MKNEKRINKRAAPVWRGEKKEQQHREGKKHTLPTFRPG